MPSNDESRGKLPTMRDTRVLGTLVLLLTCGLANVACTGADDGSASEAQSTPEAAPAQPQPPAREPQPSDAIALARGNDFDCVLQRSGKVTCWSSRYLGQVGPDHRFTVTIPQPLQIGEAVAIAATMSTVCAVGPAGSVACWEFEVWQGPSAPTMMNVEGVYGLTELRAAQGQFCAKGKTVWWCWGSSTGLTNVATLQSPGTWKLSLPNIRSLSLGWRSFAFFEDGNAVAWDMDGEVSEIADVVEALSDPHEECLVRSSGVVESFGVEIESLRGARQLAWVGPKSLLVGILPDGTLGVRARTPQQPTFVDAHDLVVITADKSRDDLLGIRRDGRVFLWQRDAADPSRYVPGEIVLRTVQ